MDLNLNDGDRPSKLVLDRLATGELPMEQAEKLRADLSPEALAHLDAVERSKQHILPFDADALRARSTRTADAPPVLPKAANTRWFVSLLMIAAALLVAVLVIQSPETELPDHYIGVRGTAGLTVHQLQGDLMLPHQDQTVGEGDVLGFKVDGRGHQSVVLLSVDGTGALNVYWPERPGAAEPLQGHGDEALHGSLTLDDAPGPEVFIAVYDQPVQAATEQAARAWRDGGAHGLMQWAYDTEDVDAHWVQRR